MTIVGTRPEIIRLSETIKKCDAYFNHVLVHTGQNWDYRLNEIFFEQLGLRKPDHFLGSVGETLGETIGNIVAKSYRVLLEESPDAVLLLGDTNSTLSAISAKRLKVPVFHMEAGNRCFDENVPEEINRRLVDHISDVNLPYTEHSRRHLIAEGIRPGLIFVTGSPMAEVLQANAGAIEASNVLDRMHLEQGGYIVVSAHREENIDPPASFAGLMEGISAVAERYGLPVIYSAHPRSVDRISRHGFEFHPLVQLVEPLGFPDYVKLQCNAFCVLSDSGTLSEESAMLGFPAVLIRTSTERPEAIENGVVVLGGVSDESIVQSVEVSRGMHVADEPYAPPSDYVSTNVSAKVVRIIESYVQVVNRVVWGR